jgi:hypothetical protein
LCCFVAFTFCLQVRQIAGADGAIAASDLHQLLPYISVAEVLKLQANTLCLIFLRSSADSVAIHQDAEQDRRQMPATTDTLAMMEIIRRQRKLLLLWDGAFHALQVCATATTAVDPLVFIPL